MTSIKNKQKTVIVLGAGRSGTSVTAGVLNILGVDLGDFGPPDETNPHGYFEDIGASKLIKEVYDLVVKDWKNPPSYKECLAQKDKFGQRIKQFCVEKSRSKEIWGWKVPGTILTIELFLPYLVNPHFVVVLRNPLANANSLVIRRKNVHGQEIGLFQALRLSNFYNGEIFNFLARHPSLPTKLVAYENIVEEPIEEANELADFLDLELTEEKAKEINNFVIPRSEIQMKKKLVFFKTKFINKLRKVAKESLKKPSKIP